MFLLEKISFTFFGPTTWAMRAPFALAGVLSILLIYFLVKEIRGKSWALVASLLSAISAYLVWINRISYGESLVIVFTLLGWWFLVRYLKYQASWDIILFGASIGLALSAKYTAMFAFPAVFFYLLFWHRSAFKNKKFWLGFLTMMVVLLPVIFYNLMVFKTRGHFDATLSHIFGLRPDDFAIIKNRTTSFSWSNIGAEIQALFVSSALPLVWLKIAAVVYLLIKLFKRQARELEKIVLVNVFFIAAMFLFMGPAARYLSIIEPYLLIGLSVLIVDFWLWSARGNDYAAKLFFGGLVSLVVAWELVFCVNTNLIFPPWGQSSYFYAPHHLTGRGWNKLEHLIQKEIFPDLPEIRSIKTTEDFKIDLVGSTVYPLIIFDDRIDWFGEIWYLNKYLVFYELPVFSISHLLSFLPKDASLLPYLKSVGFDDFWFILAVGNGVLNDKTATDAAFTQSMLGIAGYLESSGFQPQIIMDYQGEAAFKVYHFQ